MTRFIYLADTHLGAAPMGYNQQIPYPERLSDILTALDGWINQDGDIDFMIHGGDMIDRMSEDMVRRASDLFQFSIPVYLCLGNHDLTAEDSLDQWLKVAPEFFPDGHPEYLLDTPDGVVYVMPNHWCATPYYWGEVQDPQFSSDQQNVFNGALMATSKDMQVFVTHSPVFGLPPAQTLLPEPLHEPAGAFSNTIGNLTAAHPGIRCVLGAHNHMNMHIEKTKVHYVTVSAFVESPFEFKLFEMQSDLLSMTTISLADRLPFKADYDKDKTFVQGRMIDRSFTHLNNIS